SILSVTGNDTATPKFTLSRAIVEAENLTISYDPATGNTFKTSNSIELGNILNTSVVNNVVTPVIIMSDDFNDNSIDPLKWTIYQPTNTTVAEASGRIEISATGPANHPIGLMSINDYSSVNDKLIIQANVTQ